MLKIDQQQYDALMAGVRSAFRQRLAAHVHQQFPAYAAAVGASGVTALVELAQARGQRRGYMAEPEVVIWLDLMVRLGVAFDEDPLLPWGGKLPDAAREGDPLRQLNAIHDTAEGYLNQVCGEGGALFSAAIGRFLQASPQELVVQPSQSSEQLVNALARLYPEKHQAADYPAQQAFMQKTIARCLDDGINVKDKIVLLIQFDYLLGWEASASPVFMPALTNAGLETLAGVSLPELLQRMKALMQGLLTAPPGSR